MDREADNMILYLQRRGQLKAGDNSHLKAETWVLTDKDGNQLAPSLFDFEDLGHKARDYGSTNWGDIRASVRATTCLGEKYDGAHIVANSKHTRPVIIGKGDSQLEATVKAVAADVMSPFGGFWSFNTPLEYNTALFLNKVFAEGFVASDYEKGAAELLRDTDPSNNPHNLGSHKNRFILKTGPISRSDLEVLRISISGGDAFTQDYETSFNVFTDAFVAAGNNGNRKVSLLDPEILKSVDFGCNVAPHLNSNLVFYLVGDAIAGLGDGCGNRYSAAHKGRDMLEMSVYAAMSKGDDMLWQRVLYGTSFDRADFEPFIPSDPKIVVFSDAFYPKPDGFIESTGLDRIKEDFKGGIINHNGEQILLKRDNHDPNYDRNLAAKAVVEPGGSMGDHYVIGISDRFNIPLILTISPDKANQYLDNIAAGKSPGVSGRRFFNHDCHS